MFSQTFGITLGDWIADTAGMRYTGAAVVFGGILALATLAYHFTAISRNALFWAAFILARLLDAVMSDFLGKPLLKVV